MPAGRPRTPTANLASWRAKLPERIHELQLPPIAGSCPECLVGEARAEWDRSIAPLCARGIVADVDLGGAIALCESWAQYHGAMETLKTEGCVVEGSRGPTRNPHLQVANEALAIYLKVCPAFGLLPANRSRVSAAAEAGKLDRDKGRFFKFRPRDYSVSEREQLNRSGLSEGVT